VSAEQCFAIGSDVWDKALHGEHDWNAAEQENENEEEDELPDATIGRDIPRTKSIPRDDGAEEDKHPAVEHEVNDCREWYFIGFLSKPSVVGKAYSSAECYEEVVAAECGADSDAENGQQKVEYDE